MPDAKEERLPLWPLRLTLTVLLVVEVFFVLRLAAEGVTDNILMIVNSVGLLVFCVLTWRGIPWCRWLLITLLLGRVATIGFYVISQISPSDHRFIGTLLVAVFYVALGLLIASPLGRSSKRADT
jgi:hypothetical protein